LENEAFYSHILTLVINDKSEKVILKDLQRHPFKPRITHIDLQRISENEAITMRVPLHFRGGDVAPGVKIGGGIVSHMQSEVSIRCLPANLPEYIDVDLSHLELNAGVYLSDLKLPKDVEIMDLAYGGEDRAVAMVYIPRAVTETAEVAVAAPVEGEAATTPAAEGKEKGAAAEGKPAAGKPAAKPAGKEKGK
jgi:large subunit ribosomal protein L25